MSNRPSNADGAFMRRAIELSRKGFPAPNPHVGCVIVKDGEVIGEGWHEHAGGPHAEAMALANCDDPRGADVYVTLEPCNHHGRTPPCSEALIAAGVERVIVACQDPNPKAQGGIEALRAAGIEVITDFLTEEAADANRQFLFAMSDKRPYVVVKSAMTLDGKIALPNGQSKWITSPEARQEGHRLRAELGAVLVGRGTVQSDDPELTARIEGVVNQPTKIILDPQRRLSGSERVFATGQVIHVDHPFDLHELMRDLFGRGITGILVEGGAETITRLVRTGLVDRFELFVAPMLFGAGKGWIGDLRIESVPEATRLRFVAVRTIGPDVWLTAEPTPRNDP